MSEIWKKVVLNRWEYPYFVSNLGRIKNEKGNLLKPFSRNHRNGKYFCVDLCKYGKRKRMCVHRLVALHFIPNPEYKLEVNHLDRDPFNNRADNLEWCTRVENEMHKRFMEAHLELGEAV